ncbi:toll-like receptor 5 [Pseudophryne corroboree]|uniref:toll-like receptor 5 n=1 Tax=Pseudophryne corroboree TaxID=495146 RepID=UPI003081F351
MFCPAAALLFLTLSSTFFPGHSSNCVSFLAKSRFIFSCQAQGLFSIPSVPFNTQVLLLNFNHIPSISQKSFLNLTQLQDLSLGAQNNNGSLVIEEAAFQTLTTLTTLDLGGNRNLIMHPKAFKGLSQLKILLLDSNGLDESVLESNLFGELTSLRKLDLSFNNLRRLRPDPSFLKLHSLSTILLKLNKINQLCGKDLQNLQGRRLELLDLSSNPLQVSNTSLCTNPFMNITLGTLDISSTAWNTEQTENFFKIISGTQVEQVKMRHGSLLGSGFGFNNLKNPDENTFSGLNFSNVLIFDFSHSFTSKLEPYIFAGVSKLLSLDLSFSKLHIISPGAFSGLRELVSLNMSGNLIGDLTRSTLESLWSSPLKVLDISSNHIGAIQFGAMDGLVSLDSLNLRDNALNNIPSVKLPGLTIVLLKQNRISDTYGITTFCPNCKLLDLSSNRLTDLRSLREILELRSLKILMLSSNQLSQCSPKPAVKPLNNTSLLFLDLSDNDLGQVWTSGQCSDIFRNLGLLKTLNLAKNHIYSFPEDLFQELVSLQALDLSRNYLRLLPQELFTDLKALKTLNIRNNNFVTLSPSSFKPLTSLKSVDLSEVTLICNCGLTDFWNWIRTTNVTVQVSYTGKISCLRLSPPVQEIPLEAYFKDC